MEALLLFLKSIGASMDLNTLKAIQDYANRLKEKRGPN